MMFSLIWIFIAETKL